MSDLNLSAISLQELNESGSPTYGSAIRRGRNINKEINYSEVDGTEALVDNDDDMEYKPVLGHTFKRPLDQKDVVAENETIKRGRGRPKGSKNKNNPPVKKGKRSLTPVLNKKQKPYVNLGKKQKKHTKFCNLN